jgi:hypothetical protein
LLVDGCNGRQPDGGSREERDGVEKEVTREKALRCQ